MATGRIRRSARRGLALATFGWLGVAAFAVLMAPSASAAATATVHIRDLTPPVASVDAGGTVTFINEIQDKTLQVGVGPLAVTATVHTDVTLRLPSGEKPLRSGQSVSEKFSATCGCTITWTYRVDGALLNQLAGQLPALPVPTPFVVNTLVPLPTLPSTNLPPLPQVNVPLPGGGGGPVPPVVPPGGPGTVTPDPTGTTGGTPVEGVPGTEYTYNTGAGTPQMSPVDTVAAAAFDPSRYFVPGRSLGGADRGGSGGAPGSYDGASVPVFGQLAGLNSAALDAEKAEAASASGTSAAQTLPVAALAAVVALAAVTAALVRTHQASRASR
jgi:hypothetical protein